MYLVTSLWYLHCYIFALYAILKKTHIISYIFYSFFLRVIIKKKSPNNLILCYEYLNICYIYLDTVLEQSPIYILQSEVI